MKSNYKRPVVESIQMDRFERCYAAVTNPSGCHLCPEGVDEKSITNPKCKACMLVTDNGKSRYDYCKQ